MSLALLCGGQQPLSVASAPETVPGIVNWPVQKRKVWRGKRHLPTWTELRRVASEAIDQELKTYSLEQLVEIVKVPCREARLKASSNSRDKNAQVKREYHNMVMDLLKTSLVNRAEETQTERDAAGQILTGNTPVTCGCSCGAAAKADGVATAPGRGTERLNVKQINDAASIRIDDRTHRVGGSNSEAIKRDNKGQGQPDWDIEAQYLPIKNIPQHTGLCGLFRGFFNPRVALTTPMADATEKALYMRPGGEDVVKETSEPWKPQLNRAEEDCDAGLQEWVKVEEDLGKDWVSVVAKKS